MCVGKQIILYKSFCFHDQASLSNKKVIDRVQNSLSSSLPSSILKIKHLLCACFGAAALPELSAHIAYIYPLI